MQTIVVSVGPLASASANNICASQTPNAGTLLLNGTPSGGKNTKSWQGTAAISGNVMTVSANASGAATPGALLTGQGVAASTVVQAPGPSAGTWIVTPAQTVSSTTIYGNQLVTLDVPRQVLLTTTADETAHTFTLSGTDWAGSPISETITGVANSTVASVLSYATVTSLIISANATGALTVGTNGVASSQWTKLDGWSPGPLLLQCTATGTVNYTVQNSLDNPNSNTNSVSPASMTWISSSDSNLVNATGNVLSTSAFSPTFVRVVLNSGSGSVKMTIRQQSVVPY